MTTVLGIAVIVVWLAACALWAVLSLPGGLMANASGAFSPDRHMAMLYGLALGQLLVALAGVPAGLAVFIEERRSTLLWTFAGLAAVGIALQIGSVAWFFLFGRK